MAKRLQIIALLFLFAGLTPAFAQPCDCVSTGNCPVPITDNGTYCGVLNVTVDGPNDLGTCPLSSVCFTITHTWIGDLSATLTSPSGESFILMADNDNNFGGCGDPNDGIDVCFVGGTGNPLTNNTPYPSGAAGPCPAGTCYLTGNWNLACGGVVDPVTNVLQAPNCDLDDFNVPGDPANGTWSLCINDVCNMDTGTLDNFSLNFSCGTSSCIVCEADGGEIDTTTFRSCEGNPNLLLTLPPDYGATPPPDSDEYSYGYLISQGGIILEVDSLADLTGQPAGTYQVHGLSYWTNDSTDLSYVIGLDTALLDTQLLSTTAPFCGDLSSTFMTVIIESIPAPTIIDTTVCVGECIMVNGSSICENDTLTMASWLGCDSVIFVYITEISVNADIQPSSPPTLTCANPTATLDGATSTPGTVTYLWTGPGPFLETTSSVTVDVPGTYTLVVSENSVTPACTSTTTIDVMDGFVSPDLSVGGAPQICNGDDFDLNNLTINDLNNTNPVITFHDGTPASPSNELSSTDVSPTATTVYYILATTGNCSDEEAVTITVTNLPTADFNTNGPTCVSGSTTVTYAGNASAGATYTWDFGGGVATPGTGPGPHDVTWPNSGAYTVTLSVEENDCTSTVFSENVDVESALPQPVILCNTTTSTVEFSWNTVPGATGYSLNVISSHTGLLGPGDTTFLVDNLSPNEDVTIEVIAIGAGTCGNSSAQQTCTAQNCPGVTVDIDPVADICLTAASTEFDLGVTVNGGNGSGVLSIHGDGIIDSNIGTFDPQSAIIGINSIVANYSQGNCLFSGSININVFQTPTAEFTAESGICEGDAATITYTGTAPAGSTFNWDFNGGTAVPGTGPGPHEVTWPLAGTYSVSLNVDSPDGCASQTETSNVSIDAPLAEPVISCSVTTSSVTFNWVADADVTSYNVSSTSGHSLTELTPTSWQVTGLDPDETASIEVEAVGTTACGNVTVQQSCTSQDCPDVTISIDPVADICTTPSTVPFIIPATITDTSSLGNLVWDGPGITNSQTGEFDPLQANNGANLITVTYTESTCVFSENISINVSTTPQGSISATPEVCTGAAATVTYTGDLTGVNFDWNFDGGVPTNIGGSVEGPYEVTWSSSGNYTITLILFNADGCFVDNITTDVQVDSPVQAPIVNCSQTTTTSVEFSWNFSANATDYDVTILSGQTASDSTPTSITFTGLNPEEEVSIEVSASNAGACSSSVVQATCNADPCPSITIDIDPVADYCIGNAAPTQLVANVVGSAGTGTGIWSGNGVDQTSGMFDPMAVSFGAHEVVYTFTEATCSYTDTVIINVNQEPTADFSADAAICMLDAATITFAGVAGGSANYTWDFNGGTATPGTGAGPHTVTWSTPGAKIISLSVVENGCTSQNFIQNVQVDEALVDPIITCTSTTDSVIFTWDNNANATGYMVQVLTGPTGVQSGNVYTFSGLDPGQEVSIELTVTGNTSCPFPVVSATCQAEQCPIMNAEIEPVSPICLTGTNDQVQLQATLNGGNGTGSILWSGTGIIDPIAGIFAPSLLGPGDYSVTYTYTEANCSVSNETTISLMPPPVADAGEDYTLSCWESDAEYRLGGDGSTTGSNIQYTWAADFGSFPENDAILHPTVDMPGTFTLTVTNTLLGCSDSDDVVVSTVQDLPLPELDVQQNSCQGQNDAMVSIQSVSGGMEPFLFSLNGEPYVDADTFPFLQPGDYELAVIDAAGCENMSEFTINTPADLSVELTTNIIGRPITTLGEPIQLLTISSIPLSAIDSIHWSPADLLSCTYCLDPLASPTEETEFSVTLFHNGCEATDILNIFVEYESPIYVPNAFSPNGDGTNDFFTLYPGPYVEEVKNFMVFDRWGEMVFERQNFIPNNPAMGWDGSLDGKPLNPAVFVWFAEIKMADGTTQMLEGDVTLVR